MAKTEKDSASSSKDVPSKSGIKEGGVLDRYKVFLEEHFSRDDHNAQKVVTDVLTVESKGTFDYVSIKWTIHTDQLKATYPNLPLNKWSLHGIRRFSDFTALNAFPQAVVGETFLKTSQSKGTHNEYLKAEAPTNFAFFLVGEYSSLFSSNKKEVIGPLTLSFTPLRASTKEMCEEIRGLGNASVHSGAHSTLAHRKALLAECTEEEKEIRKRTDLSDDEKEAYCERLWALYNLFGNEDR